MCGIAGYATTKLDARNVALEPVLARIAHRGPDGEGSWSDEACCLAQRRLAIIDLSDNGTNPLPNEDRTVWSTFNGEIYNFRDLRADLERLGHRFRSGTDSEVVVHGYEEWGTGCVERFRGMFALAVWDQRAKTLFLARDRVGKKPLFYSFDGASVAFASEIQALLAFPGISRQTDLEAIDAYLSWGYIPAPKTGFRQISKLPPAHWMTMDFSGPAPKHDVNRYWSLSYLPKEELSLEEAGEATRAKMSEAVKLRLMSDVPLGAFLSGGIDSSIVVGLMAEHMTEPVKTFSIGFDESAFDELAHARRIADLWGTDHHEAIVRPDALSILPMLVRHYGEPYADSSAIPTYCVSQMTRQHVTVALNGDGGDETFGGYERYRANQIAGRLASIPGSGRAATLLSNLLPDSPDPKNALRRARRFLKAAREPQTNRYARWVGYFQPEDKALLYREDFKEQVNSGDHWFDALFSETAGLEPLDAAMSVDVRSYLPFDLLVKVDIAAMATSLEARSPFLDHEVMEFAARLPISLKVRRGRGKYLLCRAFSDLLPSENVRRRKMGFGVPVGDWMRHQLRELLLDCLLGTGSHLKDYFQAPYLERLASEHIDGRSDSGGLLWTLLMLEMWHREMAT